VGGRGDALHVQHPPTAVVHVGEGEGRRLRAEVVQATAEHSTLEAGAWDLILLADVLQWVDPGLAGREAARLLRPSGVVAVIESQMGQTPFQRDLQEVFRRLNPRATASDAVLYQPDAAHDRTAVDLYETMFVPDVLAGLRDLAAAAEAAQRIAVSNLATVWADANPQHVVERIVRIEKEAASVHITWPRWTPFLCEQIVARTPTPSSWASALMESDSPGDLVLPFLRSAASVKEPEWQTLVSSCLDKPNFRWAALSVLLSMSEPPEELIAKALANLDGYARLIEILCMRKQIAEDVVKQLLCHPDEKIAAAAANGIRAPG